MKKIDRTDPRWGEREVERMITGRYSGHEYRVEAHGENIAAWYGRNPEHPFSEFWFRVVMQPGMIAIWGDIGEMMLLPHERTLRGTFLWMRGATDLYYILSKIPVEMRGGVLEYDADHAISVAKDAVEQHVTKEIEAESESPDEIRNEVMHDLSMFDSLVIPDRGPESIADILVDDFDFEGEEVPDLMTWDIRFLNRVAALRHMTGKVEVPR